MPVNAQHANTKETSRGVWMHRLVPVTAYSPFPDDWRVDCKVYSIAQGSMSSTHENLFLGTLPKRIILWCVDNDALNGAFGKNPFHAKNNAIALDIDDMALRAQIASTGPG